MTTSDPIADLLTRIRNSLMAKHRYVDVPWSRLKQGLVAILKEQGLVEDFIVKDTDAKGVMRVFLKYTGRKPVIQGLKRASKPGKRQYVAATNIPRFYGGLGVSIVSTSQGLLTGNEAQKRGIGGELLCTVW